MVNRFCVGLSLGMVLAGAAWAAAGDCCSSTVVPMASAQPAVTYRLDYRTLYEPQTVTAYRIEYETVYEDREVTSYRPIWENQTQERRYRVARELPETSEREERRTVYKPV